MGRLFIAVLAISVFPDIVQTNTWSVPVPKELAANFDVNGPGLGDQKTVTATAGEHGLIDPKGVIAVAYETSITFAAEPNTGYMVDAWYLDGSRVQSSGESYELANIRANHTVHVTFKPLQYTITGRITSGGLGVNDVVLVGLGVVTNQEGFYVATVDYGWSGTVTPTKHGYTFDPNSRSYTTITADDEDEDYYAQPAGDVNDHTTGLRPNRDYH